MKVLNVKSSRFLHFDFKRRKIIVTVWTVCDFRDICFLIWRQIEIKRKYVTLPGSLLLPPRDVYEIDNLPRRPAAPLPCSPPRRRRPHSVKWVLCLWHLLPVGRAYKSVITLVIIHIRPKKAFSLVAMNARQCLFAWWRQQTKQWNQCTIVTPFVLMTTNHFCFFFCLNKLSTLAIDFSFVTTMCHYTFSNSLRRKRTLDNTRNKAHFLVAARARWLCCK